MPFNYSLKIFLGLNSAGKFQLNYIQAMLPHEAIFSGARNGIFYLELPYARYQHACSHLRVTMAFICNKECATVEHG